MGICVSVTCIDMQGVLETTQDYRNPHW